MKIDQPSLARLSVGMFVSGFLLMCAQVALTRLMAAAIGSYATFAILGFVMLGLASSGTRVFVHRTQSEVIDLDAALQRAAISMVGSLVAFVGITAIPAVGEHTPVAILFGGVFVVPFFYVGYFITRVLEDHTEHSGKLYGADLLGSAVGAVAVVFLLDRATPQVVFLILACSSAAAGLLLRQTRRNLLVLSVVSLVLVGSLVFPSLTQLRYAATTSADDLKWESWDHLGQVSVLDYPEGLRETVSDSTRFRLEHLDDVDDRANFVALGWAMSREYRGPIPETEYIRIDSGVGTAIVEHTVARNSDVLEWDVTAAGFVAAGEIESAAIVGTGGGRDVMTALRYGAERVSAFEINPKVVRVVETEFKTLSGGPYSLAEVTPYIGDARSMVRGTGPYDLLELPMTDTYTASSSGILVFSENALYTQEAFVLFLSELAPGGVFSVSRFFAPERLGEVGRILSSLREAVKIIGGNPLTDIAVVYGRSLISDSSGIGNVLVKRGGFSEADLERLRAWNRPRKFELLYPSESLIESQFTMADILKENKSRYENSVVELSPIVDDRPFFYDTKKPLQSTIEAFRTGDVSIMSVSVKTLLLFLLIVIFASKMFVIDPIRRSEQAAFASGDWTTLFFAAIGFGFLAVELAVIQRCTLFLGHPTYALTVVLFSLLLSSAAGSWLSTHFDAKRLPYMGIVVVGAACVGAFVQPWVLTTFEAHSFSVRIAVAVCSITPLGLVMGTLYPTSLRLLESQDRNELVPWCWAVNGTAGVIATTAGMFIAMRLGYTGLFVAGMLGYGVATYAAFLALRSVPRAQLPLLGQGARKG